MAVSSEKGGDRNAAAKEYSDFLAAWKDADPDSAQRIRAQAYLAEHRSVAGGTSGQNP